MEVEVTPKARVNPPPSKDSMPSFRRSEVGLHSMQLLSSGEEVNNFGLGVQSSRLSVEGMMTDRVDSK